MFVVLESLYLLIGRGSLRELAYLSLPYSLLMFITFVVLEPSVRSKECSKSCALVEWVRNFRLEMCEPRGRESEPMVSTDDVTELLDGVLFRWR